MAETCGICQEPITESTGTVDGRPTHIQCWLEANRGSTAEWVNNAITLYRDDETGEVIGVMLKNVRQVMEGHDCNDFHRGD